MVKEEFKPVSFSRTTITELMVPGYANFGGKVHGGTLLSLMDKVAYVCSSKHAGTYCVTVSIDAVDFHRPVEVGDLVSLHASVNYVGKSSLIIGIKVVAENFRTNLSSHTNTSYFTMVAVDENLKPAAIPGLLLQNPEEVRRFVKAKVRREFGKKKQKELGDVISRLEDSQDLSILSGENCMVASSL